VLVAVLFGFQVLKPWAALLNPRNMNWIDAYEIRPEVNRPVIFIDYDRGHPMARIGWWTGIAFMANGLNRPLSRNARFYVYEDELGAPEEKALPDDFEW